MKRHSSLPLVFLLLLSLVLTLSSCASRETREARTLLALADSAFSADRYDDVISLVDSLSRTYPSAIEEREQAMKIYVEAKYKRCQRDSTYLMAQVDHLVSVRDSLVGSFVKMQKESEYIDRLRYRGLEPSAKIDLDAFVLNQRELALESLWRGTRPLNGRYVVLKDQINDTYIVSDTLSYDNATNYRYQTGGLYYERLSFSSTCAMSLSSFVCHAPEDHPISVWIYGENDHSVHYRLSPQSRMIISQTYKYVKTLDDIDDSRQRLAAVVKRLELLTSKVPD